MPPAERVGCFFPLQGHCVRWLCGAFLLFSAAAQGASLELTLRHSQNRPVENAVVALIPETAGAYGDRPAAVMDQRDRQFAPHVIAVRTNTLVHFPNSDDIRHHVYSFSAAKRFELRLYHGTTAEPVLFDQAGEVALGCNIHDGMLGYIYVLDSEWFAVSKADGRVEIKGIPPGDYRLQVHHPRLAQPLDEGSVTLTTDESVVRALTLPRLRPDPREAEPDSELERLFKR